MQHGNLRDPPSSQLVEEHNTSVEDLTGVMSGETKIASAILAAKDLNVATRLNRLCIVKLQETEFCTAAFREALCLQ